MCTVRQEDRSWNGIPLIDTGSLEVPHRTYKGEAVTGAVSVGLCRMCSSGTRPKLLQRLRNHSVGLFPSSLRTSQQVFPHGGLSFPWFPCFSG